MHSKEALLDSPEVKSWLETHQGACEEASRAASLLFDKDDAVVAMNKLLPALGSKRITVFFSYKTTDAETAKAVVALLRKYSADKLNIVYQADFPNKIVGREWRGTIKKAISGANWFILLLPDPSEELDWCLYETGLFDRQLTSADRMICLHHPDVSIPDPISEYEGIKANHEEVAKFLRMIYIDEDPIPGLPPINKAVESDIGAIADQIVSVIRSPIEHHTFEPQVTLSIPDAADLKGPDDLDKAMLVDATDDALELFDYASAPPTWGKLRSTIVEPEGDLRWREELFHVIRRVANGRRFYPVQAVFQAHNGKYYRPILHSIDTNKAGKNIVKFYLTFTEDISYIDRSTIPNEIYRLAALLRFAFRFRWEVLEKYAVDTLENGDIERVDNAFRRLGKEWESRELGDAFGILDLFSGKERAKVGEMLQEWSKMRNKQGNGELDKAIENGDPQAVAQILKKFLPLNTEFLEITADRFSQVIQRNAAP